MKTTWPLLINWLQLQALTDEPSLCDEWREVDTLRQLEIFSWMLANPAFQHVIIQTWCDSVVDMRQVQTVLSCVNLTADLVAPSEFICSFSNLNVFLPFFPRSAFTPWRLTSSSPSCQQCSCSCLRCSQLPPKKLTRLPSTPCGQLVFFFLSLVERNQPLSCWKLTACGQSLENIWPSSTHILHI